MEASARAGQAPLVYFDLDSTLFNVKPRLKKIMREFGHLETTASKYPSASQTLKVVEEISESYHLHDHMKHFGLENQPMEFYKELYNYWMENFFHSDYLLEDVPNEGAVEYVNELYGLGARIVYLTGRDKHRMEEGSILSLKKWKFPMNETNAVLVLKPHKDHDDAEFKRDHFNAIQDRRHPIWFFENEPHNIHLLLKDSPHVKIVFFDSVHSGKSEPPAGLPVVTNFKYKR